MLLKYKFTFKLKCPDNLLRIIITHVIQDVYVFLSSVKNKLFFDENIPRIISI